MICGKEISYKPDSICLLHYLLWSHYRLEPVSPFHCQQTVSPSFTVSVAGLNLMPLGAMRTVWSHSASGVMTAVAVVSVSSDMPGAARKLNTTRVQSSVATIRMVSAMLSPF